MAETQGPPQGPPPGAPQGPPPHPLFLERMGRIQTAIHCGTPDRVPLSLVLETPERCWIGTLDGRTVEVVLPLPS